MMEMGTPLAVLTSWAFWVPFFGAVVQIVFLVKYHSAITYLIREIIRED